MRALRGHHLCKVLLSAPGPPTARGFPRTPALWEAGPSPAVAASERGSMRLDPRLRPGRSLRVAGQPAWGRPVPPPLSASPAAG